MARVITEFGSVRVLLSCWAKHICCREECQRVKACSLEELTNEQHELIKALEREHLETQGLFDSDGCFGFVLHCVITDETFIERMQPHLHHHSPVKRCIRSEPEQVTRHL